LRLEQYEDPTSSVQIDPRLQDVVERMFQRCYDDGEFKQVFIFNFLMQLFNILIFNINFF
jgi:hypothetical protein